MNVKINKEYEVKVNEACKKKSEQFNIIVKPSSIIHKALELYFNKESELLNTLDHDAIEIKGSMNIDKKEEILLAFADGDIKRIITKPKMTSFGLNWQHCNHTVLFPTWSYEQYYQAIRRFWRFGQKSPVTVDLVYSDDQKRVLETLELKTRKSIELQKRLNDNLHGHIEPNIQKKSSNILLPSFI